MGRGLTAPAVSSLAIRAALGLAVCSGALCSGAACSGPRRPIESASPTAAERPTADAPVGSDAPLADRVRARVMRVAITETRTRDQARERATALARTARADDFSDIASQYGDGDEPRRSELASAGLEITADAPALVPPSVREAALALAVREVSRPIESEDGFWILQRTE